MDLSNLIEEASGPATNLTMWHQKAKEVLRLTPRVAPWLNDVELLQLQRFA
jgi:hypothetical protein